MAAEELFAAIDAGEPELVRALLAGGADVAHARTDGWTALIVASWTGHLEGVRALLEAGADVAQAMLDGWTALMSASNKGHAECVRALLEAGADVLQLRNDGTCVLDFVCGARSLATLQLICAYAPSRAVVHAQLALRPGLAVAPACAQWLDTTSRWSSPLHHFELLPLERVRALLVAGADVRAADDGGADAPTPVSLAVARLRLGADGRAALIIAAAAPWSPKTHALFPALAKARAVELLRVGWLLARRFQRVCAEAAEVEGALREVWLGHVMPFAIERASV